MSKFTELFLGGGGKVLAPSLQTNFFTSRTWTAPQDGIVVIRAMGAGGGGARKPTNATGGYSGSWGAKALRVTKGTTVTISIGAGGAGKASTDGDGAAGGNTSVTVNGVTYTATGGPGGKQGATVALPDGPSPSSNWDFGAASVKPGWAPGITTGGAGVDILAQGGNATTSDSTAASGGGGTGSPSVDTTGGGAFGTASAMGQPAASPGVFFDAGGGDWGISFYGGSGGSSGGAAAAAGGNGGGGASAGGAGGNGGGGGGGNYGGGGGIGGGGGAANGYPGGNGGQGYAHLKFYADMGI